MGSFKPNTENQTQRIYKLWIWAHRNLCERETQKDRRVEGCERAARGGTFQRNLIIWPWRHRYQLTKILKNIYFLSRVSFSDTDDPNSSISSILFKNLTWNIWIIKSSQWPCEILNESKSSKTQSFWVFQIIHSHRKSIDTDQNLCLYVFNKYEWYRKNWFDSHNRRFYVDTAVK